MTDGPYSPEEFIKIVPSTEELDPERLSGKIAEIQSSERLFPTDSDTVSLTAFTRGEEESVELLMQSSAGLDALEENLKEAYPDGHSIQPVDTDLEHELTNPIVVPADVFVEYLEAGYLRYEYEEIALHDLEGSSSSPPADDGTGGGEGGDGSDGEEVPDENDETIVVDDDDDSDSGFSLGIFDDGVERPPEPSESADMPISSNDDQPRSDTETADDTEEQTDSSGGVGDAVKKLTSTFRSGEDNDTDADPLGPESATGSPGPEPADADPDADEDGQSTQHESNELLELFGEGEGDDAANQSETDSDETDENPPPHPADLPESDPQDIDSTVKDNTADSEESESSSSHESESSDDDREPLSDGGQQTDGELATTSPADSSLPDIEGADWGGEIDYTGLKTSDEIREVLEYPGDDVRFRDGYPTTHKNNIIPLENGDAIPLRPATELPEDIYDDSGTLQIEKLRGIKGPTALKRGLVACRPAPEYTATLCERWQGRAEWRKDWMTTLGSDTRSPTDTGQRGTMRKGDGSDFNLPDTQSILSGVLRVLADAPVPMGFQVTFQPRDDWKSQMHRRKVEVEDRTEPWVQKAKFLAVGRPDEDEEEELETTRRLELMETKRPKETFNVNVRAVTPISSPLEEVMKDRVPVTETDDVRTPRLKKHNQAKEALLNLSGNLGALDGAFYEPKPVISIPGDDTPGPHPADVYDQFINHEVRTGRTENGLIERFTTGERLYPYLVANPDELYPLVTLPDDQEMSRELFRQTGRRQETENPLPRPDPETLRLYRDGVGMGYPITQEGKPESKQVCLPISKTTNHYARIAGSGHGKSIAVQNDILDLTEHSPGPTILVDQKGDGLGDNLLQAYYKKYGNLDNVYHFKAPELLPAVPFFDIRPALAGGQTREDAIMDRINLFHQVMQLIMGREKYEAAYKAKDIISYLIEAQFQQKDTDAFGIETLIDSAQEMLKSGEPPYIPDNPAADRDIYSALETFTEADENSFSATMTAVLTRFNKIKQNPHLFRAMNHVPEFDPETGTYAEGERAFNMKNYLQEDALIVFDFGQLSDGKQSLTMLVLSQLWSAIQDRKQSSKSEYEQIYNVVIEEAAPIVSTELVSEQLLPQGRSFGVALGLIMQFPKQVKSDRAYEELFNDIGTKLFGHIGKPDDIGNFLKHDNYDADRLEKKVSSLSPGRWVANFPPAGHLEKNPRPFSIQARDIAPGHPESEAPLTSRERSAFDEEYEERRREVAATHTIERKATASEKYYSPGDDDTEEPEQQEDSPSPFDEPEFDFGGDSKPTVDISGEDGIGNGEPTAETSTTGNQQSPETTSNTASDADSPSEEDNFDIFLPDSERPDDHPSSAGSSSATPPEAETESTPVSEDTGGVDSPSQENSSGADSGDSGAYTQPEEFSADPFEREDGESAGGDSETEEADADEPYADHGESSDEIGTETVDDGFEGTAANGSSPETTADLADASETQGDGRAQDEPIGDESTPVGDESGPVDDEFGPPPSSFANASDSSESASDTTGVAGEPESVDGDTAPDTADIGEQPSASTAETDTTGDAGVAETDTTSSVSSQESDTVSREESAADTQAGNQSDSEPPLTGPDDLPSHITVADSGKYHCTICRSVYAPSKPQQAAKCCQFETRADVIAVAEYLTATITERDPWRDAIQRLHNHTAERDLDLALDDLLTAGEPAAPPEVPDQDENHVTHTGDYEYQCTVCGSRYTGDKAPRAVDCCQFETKDDLLATIAGVCYEHGSDELPPKVAGTFWNIASEADIDITPSEIEAPDSLADAPWWGPAKQAPTATGDDQSPGNSEQAQHTDHSEDPMSSQNTTTPNDDQPADTADEGSGTESSTDTEQDPSGTMEQSAVSNTKGSASDEPEPIVVGKRQDLPGGLEDSLVKSMEETHKEFDEAELRGKYTEEATKSGAISGDQGQFMATLALAYNRGLEDYDLTQSMTTLVNRVGNPDIDGLKQHGYIKDVDGPFKRNYYEFTEKGWNTTKQISAHIEAIDLNKPVGENEGDLGESGAHRIGVEITAQYLKQRDDVEQVVRYPTLNTGEECDVAGCQSDGTVEIVGEVWFASNDRTSAANDYRDLASADSLSLWVVEGLEEAVDVVNTLVDRIEDGSFQVDTKVKYQEKGPSDGQLVKSTQDIIDHIYDSHGKATPGMTSLKTLRSVRRKL